MSAVSFAVLSQRSKFDSMDIEKNWEALREASTPGYNDVSSSGGRTDGPT